MKFLGNFQIKDVILKMKKGNFHPEVIEKLFLGEKGNFKEITEETVHSPEGHHNVRAAWELPT